MSYVISCGTGGWTPPTTHIIRDPLADPNNDSVLSATPVFGGIDITWTLPSLNPQAVAYAVLYRGYTDEFNLAVPYQTVAGGHFYDKVEFTGIEYFYWIKLVSVNGTAFSEIGPASAYPRALIPEVIAALSGQITHSVLAAALQASINRIPGLGADLLAEVQNRIASHDALGDAIQYANDAVDASFTLIHDEQTARVTANTALVQSLELTAAQVNTNAAAIQIEQNLNVDRYHALANTVTNTEVILGTEYATTEQKIGAYINAVGNTITDIGALYTAKVGVNGLIGGFGIYNDGTEVAAGFDVDTFWIGRTATDKIIPFIVQDEEVFINKAVIPTLTADKIDTRGLVIRDTLGNPIFGAGYNLAAEMIEGLNPIVATAASDALAALEIPAGPQGPQGIQGPQGVPGVQGYTGLTGAAGIQGIQGISGAVGTTGTTLYTWIAYANNSTGSVGFTTGVNTGQTYIGIANNKSTATESSTPSDYTWSLIKGYDGIPGTAGIDGVTTYTWFAYANNSTGTSGFTTGACTNQTYIGIAANKTTATESTNAADYTWSLIKGADGTPGTNGTNGTNGIRGSKTFYVPSQTVWSDSIANNATTAVGGSVLNDIVVEYGYHFSETRFWNGTSWVVVTVAIDGNLLVTGTIGADKISVTNLASIKSDLGAITAGNITLNTSGFIKGGQTGYNTGTGFYFGYDSGYKFSIGNSGGNGITWDGANLNIVGGGSFSGVLTASAINAVNTINIANNAVTIPVSSFTASSINNDGTLIELQSVTIVSTGAPITILSSFRANSWYPCTKITRDEIVLVDEYWTSIMAISDTPGAGTHTYKLYGGSYNGVIINMAQRYLGLLETKR